MCFSGFGTRILYGSQICRLALFMSAFTLRSLYTICCRFGGFHKIGVWHCMWELWRRKSGDNLAGQSPLLIVHTHRKPTAVTTIARNVAQSVTVRTSMEPTRVCVRMHTPDAVEFSRCSKVQYPPHPPHNSRHLRRIARGKKSIATRGVAKVSHLRRVYPGLNVRGAWQLRRRTRNAAPMLMAVGHRGRATV